MDEVVTSVADASARADWSATGGDTRFGQVAQLARSLATAHGVADVVEAAALATSEALRAASVSVGRLDAGHGTVTVLRNVGELGPAQQAVPDGESYRLTDCRFLRTLVDHAENWLYTEGGERRDEVRECRFAVDGVSGVIAAPIVLGGRIWGGMYVTRRRGDPPFDGGDVELATALAAVAGAGLAQVERVETLALLAQTDPMTGLANRRGADEALDAALAAHRGSGTPVTVVLCDVDGLKRVNDTFGHPAGDLVLTRVSALLSVASAALSDSTAARVGGDEFCLVVPGLPLAEVTAAVRALSEASRELPFGAGVSSGVASAEACEALGEEVTAKQLFRLADAAQYRAKRTGGVRVVVIGQDDVGEAGTAGRPSEVVSAPVDGGGPTPRDRAGAAVGGLPERNGYSGQFGRCVAELVAAVERAHDRPVLDRLSALATTAASQWQAAGWAVSTVDPGAEGFVTRATAVARGGSEGYVARKLARPGVPFPLNACSMTAAAVRGGSFHVELADSAAPPAALAVLAAAGYAGMIAAGSTDQAGTGWFVELYTDAMSVLPEGADEAVLAAVLRTVVALALHPGTG